MSVMPIFKNVIMMLNKILCIDSRATTETYNRNVSMTQTVAMIDFKAFEVIAWYFPPNAGHF